MNNTTNTNTHKTFCYLILFTSSAISLYLTINFMYQLGLSAGMPVIFAMVGLVFDAFKSYSPTLVAKIVSRSQVTALLLATLSVGLIGVSGAASVFSLQNGIDTMLSDSKAAKAAQLKVEAIQSEIDGLEELRSTQLSINHVSKATSTSNLISQKTSDLNEAIEAAYSATDNNLLSSFSTELVLIVAVGLEAIGIAMTFVLFHLNRETAERNTARQDETNYPESPVFTGFAPETQSKTTQVQTQQPEYTFVAATTHEQILENMRVAIQSRAIEPKHRQIWDAFKGSIRQKEIKEYLQELANRNVLKRLDNGSYVLA
ncbi:hypothetical protein P3698_22385 [Vibrio parahaemolyticus]|nr:hypothetical protein [Vibrio parahaemolyticus]MDF5522471.1 hypothetical protein [Vibrio parahaemolyticus]